MWYPQMLKTQPSESGFTLVELAIVMIIIGLLIGGILKGQELISNAKVTASIKEIKAVDAAVGTFYDKYMAYPGDMVSANTRLPNCTGAPCWGSHNPDGDTLIEGGADAGNAPRADNEAGVVFIHLTAAGMFTADINTTGTWSADTAIPDLSLGGGIRLNYSPGDSPRLITGGQPLILNGHYMVVGVAKASNVQAGSLRLSVSDAANIDRKLDDGLPNTGSVFGAGNVGAGATTCALGQAITDTYNEAGDSLACALYIRAVN